ncbi:MAG: NUDIX domain-containing protein [Verrucomicrobiales bacterium]|jgi:ADP-ribose pyrophosphatase YjhB (NUDIX family)|nr:NUDIX domain-containing protein [Verrucomicrobiales bacterium]
MLGLAVSDNKLSWPLEAGYPTPKVDVRGIVISEDKVLLVKEISSGYWTLPGGWADVNSTPAGNVERECWEESGYQVKARILTSVVEKEAAGHPIEQFTCYKLYFLCDLIGGEAKTSIESGEVKWFPLTELPELDPARSAAVEVHRAREFLKNFNQVTHFN